MTAMELLRAMRNKMLTKSDWTQSRDIQLSNDAEWQAYREALRNLPQEIEAGNIEAPTLDETGNLVFTGWPERVV